MLPNPQKKIVPHFGHLKFTVFAETYIFFIFFSKLFSGVVLSVLSKGSVCVCVCVCEREREGLQMGNWSSVFMCWSKQFWHHFWLIIAHSRLFFFFEDFISFLSTGWHTLWWEKRTGDKNYSLVVYFYFQITTVCNYVANILTWTVKLLRTLTAHLWNGVDSLAVKLGMIGLSM